MVRADEQTRKKVKKKITIDAKTRRTKTDNKLFIRKINSSQLSWGWKNNIQNV